MPTLPTLQTINNNKTNFDSSLEFISLGGIGNVTKNMYLYIMGDEILIVDCGVGFANESIIGANLVIPDISYLQKKLQTGKKIVGMLLTHGHEDHIGSLPFILPKLPPFPIFATPFTTELINLKLIDFDIETRVKKVNFKEKINLGNNFKATFLHVTHSIPDTAHIFIETKNGNFYHGSDFKLDNNPYLNLKSDMDGIKNVASLGIKNLLLDSLGAGREKSTTSEFDLEKNFEDSMKNSQGRIIITTFSSHISRMKIILDAAKNTNRKVCFIGRSVIKAKDLGLKFGYFKIDSSDEVKVEELNRFNDKNIVVIIAGSQGQENSAFFRFVLDQHRDIKLKNTDVIIFSADPIPGNEGAINELVDILSEKGVKVLISGNEEKFHTSGHGSNEELMQMISILNPEYVTPIGGTFYKMRQFEDLVVKNGFNKNKILFLDEGLEVFFEKDKISFGKKIGMEKIYIDDTSYEEMENFVLMDRQKISTEGILILLVEVDGKTGKIFGNPQVITRGISPTDKEKLDRQISKVLKNLNLKNAANDNILLRRIIKQKVEREILQRLKKYPLIIPITISV